MLIKVFVVVSSIVAVATAENCDKFGILVYEDMGCAAAIKPPNKCPSKYNCVGLTPSPNQCYFHGQNFSGGDSIDSAEVDRSCQLGCFCHQSDTNNNPMEVVCAQGGCAEYSGMPPTPGCYRKYSLDYCCSSGEICPDALPEPVAVCNLDGNVYKEGEKFFPKESCSVCLCEKGFNGTIENVPYCRRRSCGVQLSHQEAVQGSCAPLYRKQTLVRCCPHAWVCPDGTEQQVVNNNGSNTIGDGTCVFGKQTMKVGEYFQKIHKVAGFPKNIRCECKIPPLLTCDEL